METKITTKLENNLDEYARLAEAELRGVMEDIGNDATRIAKATLGTSGHGDDSIHRGIKALPVLHEGTTWTTGVGASDWKSNFFEKGTHAHSNRKRGSFLLTPKGNLKRRASLRDRSLNPGIESGVTGYRYLRTGIYAASQSLRMLVGSRLARIRV